MRTTLKVSMALYGMAMVLVIFFGVMYVSIPGYMPYHAQATGVPFDELEPGFQVLFRGLLTIYGSALFALGLAGAVLVGVPLRRDERWAKLALFAIGELYAFPSLLVTLYIRNETGANTPWLASAVGVVLVAVAAILSFVGGPERTGDSGPGDPG